MSTEPASPPLHLVLVPHTHWDREWYRTHEQFRVRLVHLLDGVLDLLERDPDFRHFTLDGQTVVVDDYLEVRPQARERIERLVRAGRLLVGPWFVLPDEWLVSGEALLRNLRLGLQRAGELGGGMQLGYVPDQFGHVGQLPQLFAGLGFQAAVLWRGVGRDVDDTLFTWEAPDGTRLPTVYLRHGYGNATGLPEDVAAAASRLAQAARALAPHSRVPSVLLMHGSDHAAPHPRLPEVVARVRAGQPDWQVEIGTLPGFVARALGEAPAELPLHRGELRSGLRAPLLPGCASARAPQKRADFENDRLLTRYLEPLAAWVQALGGDADTGLIDFIWRIALENHPHDSICGCSIDAVHDQMDTRFARVRELAEEHLTRVHAQLAAHVAPVPAAPGDLGHLVVWNPGAAGVARAEGEIALPAGVRAGALHARAADGSRLPLHAERRAPGRRVSRMRLPARVMPYLLSGLGPEQHGLQVHALRVRRRDDVGVVAIDLAPAPPDPGDFDLASAREAATRALAAQDVEQVEMEWHELPRYAVALVDAFPGHGLRLYRLARGRADGAGTRERLADGGARIANETWRVEARADGRVDLWHEPSGAHLPDALRVVSEGDRGDEYNFDAVPGDAPVERPARVRVRLDPDSPAQVGLRIDADYRIPWELHGDRRRRGTRHVRLPVRLRLRLAPGLDQLDVELEYDNTARDHRLRLHVRAPFAARTFQVESAFEVADRPIAPPPDAFGGPFAAERATGAGPQRSFASLRGEALALTVSNRGAAEAEALPEPDGGTSLAVTLLRAVGWLSRSDLVSRPGGAGPELPTPGAQVPGLHRTELSLRLHAPDAADRFARAHAHAHPPLLRAAGAGGGGDLKDGARLVELDDPLVHVSAIEPRPDGSPALRVVNLSRQARDVRLRWSGGGPPARWVAASLAGEPGAAPRTRHTGEDDRLALRGCEIACLRVSPRSGAAGAR